MVTLLGRSSKLILSLLVILLTASTAYAQPSNTQGDCISGTLFAGTSSYTYTFPSALTVGRLSVIGVYTQIRTVSSIAGAGTTFTAGVTSNNGLAGYFGNLYYAVNASTDTTTTINLSGNSGDPATVCFAEFSSVAADQSGATFNHAEPAATTTHASGSVTPATTNNVIVAFASHTSGDWTYDSAFTQVDSAGSGSEAHMLYRIQTTNSAEEENSTTADPEYSAMTIGAFSGTGGGGSGVICCGFGLRGLIY